MVQTDDESATNPMGEKIDALKNIEKVAIIFVQDKVRLLTIMFLSDLSIFFFKNACIGKSVRFNFSQINQTLLVYQFQLWRLW